MKPLVTFGDPEAAIIGYFKARFADRTETYKPTTVSNEFPTAALTDTTHLQVAFDGAPGDGYPFTERATVRVTAHAGPDHPTAAKSLASLAQGLLYVHPGDTAVAGTKPLTGRLKATDPATKNNMVSFTFRVNMNPVKVA